MLFPLFILCAQNGFPLEFTPQKCGAGMTSWARCPTYEDSSCKDKSDRDKQSHDILQGVSNNSWEKGFSPDEKKAKKKSIDCG